MMSAAAVATTPNQERTGVAATDSSAKRRPKMPKLSPSVPSLCQTTTKPPSARQATAVFSWYDSVGKLTRTSPSNAEPRVGEAAGENGLAGPALAVAAPGDDEVAITVAARSTGSSCEMRGGGVHPELGAARHTVAGEALAEDAIAVPGAVLVARPGDNEVALRVGRNRGISLAVIGVCVHLELGSPSSVPGAGKSLAENAVLVPVLVVALPHDDEVTARRHTPRRDIPGCRRCRCSPGTRCPELRPVAVEALAEDAVAVAVLVVARPR